MSRSRTLSFLLLAAVAPVASAQIPHTFTAGTAARAAEINENFAYVQTPLFFAKPTCTGGCQITKVNLAADDRQIYATLPLPEGQYLVTGKVGVDTMGQANHARVDCVLVDAANAANVDSASAMVDASTTLNQLAAVEVMQLPLVVAAGGGTVQVACRAELDTTDVNRGILAEVRNVSISAIRVASQTLTSTTHVISGMVTGGGTTTAVVTLMQGTTTVGTLTIVAAMNATGYFSFGGLPDGSYTLSVTKTGRVCTPATGTVALSGADVTDNVTCM